MTNTRQNTGFNIVVGILVLVIFILLFLIFVSTSRQPAPLASDISSAGDMSGGESAEGGVESTPTKDPVATSCEAVVDTTVLLSSRCQIIDNEQVCYASDAIEAKLAPNSTARFGFPGDIISVRTLRNWDSFELDLDEGVWANAVFKIPAFLPRPLRGQNATFIVFGETAINNTSGTMTSFDFSSGDGSEDCPEQVPIDGIVVRMPVDTGLTFQANGSSVTLMGTTVLQANNRVMTISMIDGGGRVIADGQTLYYGAGQAVTIPLGEDLSPSGPPAGPNPAELAAYQMACLFTGIGCDPGSMPQITAEVAQTMVDTAITIYNTTPTVPPTRTPVPTATRKPTFTPLPTYTNTPVPKTNTPVPTSTNTPTGAGSTGSAVYPDPNQDAVFVNLGNPNDSDCNAIIWGSTDTAVTPAIVPPPDFPYDAYWQKNREWTGDRTWGYVKYSGYSFSLKGNYAGDDGPAYDATTNPYIRYPNNAAWVGADAQRLMSCRIESEGFAFVFDNLVSGTWRIYILLVENEYDAVDKRLQEFWVEDLYTSGNFDNIEQDYDVYDESGGQHHYTIVTHDFFVTYDYDLKYGGMTLYFISNGPVDDEANVAGVGIEYVSYP